jgi:hypothetical protein
MVASPAYKVPNGSSQIVLCATTIQRCTPIELSLCSGRTTAGPLIPNEPAMIDADPSVRVTERTPNRVDNIHDIHLAFR